MTDYKIITTNRKDTSIMYPLPERRPPFPVSNEVKAECVAVVLEAGAKIARIIAEDLKNRSIDRSGEWE